jgi:type IV secretory pathway TrbD component
MYTHSLVVFLGTLVAVLGFVAIIWLAALFGAAFGIYTGGI